MKNYKNKNPLYGFMPHKATVVLGQQKEPENLVSEPMDNYELNKNKCLYCYENLPSETYNFHDYCSKKFFGQAYVPTLEYDKEALAELARQFLKANMAVSGVQPKISLSWFKKTEKNTVKKLTIVGLYGDYILKPPSDYYDFLPEMEHCTMKMAFVCGLQVVPNTLFVLADGTLCYLTKRVDRTKTGMKHMEDMCQLTERLTEDKYKGSHEQVAKAILKYSDAPLLDVGNYYEYVVFSFLTGNADMHLKNFSLLETQQAGKYMLAPAYDLLCTALVNRADKEELALTLNGKKSNLNYNDFVSGFKLAGLSQKFLDKTLVNFYYCRLEMKNVIEKSFLPENLKTEYYELLLERFKSLGLY